MNLFKKMMGGQRAQPDPRKSLEEDFKALASLETEAARRNGDPGLAALYPELGGAGRRRRRGADPEAAELDDYVPELDDYEPGRTGKYLSDEPLENAIDTRIASVRARLLDEPALATAGAGDDDFDIGPGAADPAPRQPVRPAAPAAAPPRAAAPVRPATGPLVPGPAGPAGPPAAEDAYEDDFDDDFDDDFEDDDSFDDPAAPAPAAEPHRSTLVQVPAPAAGRAAGQRAGRVKTRLIGFGQAAETDPFEAARSRAPGASVRFPAGWIVVVKGPGRGASFTIFDGVSPIGRGEDQAIRLDFGDNAISRTNHATIAYDSEQKKFFIGHGGKANLVRLNGKPVLSTEDLKSEDTIRIGETTLKFVAFCGPDFDWTSDEETGGADAASV